MIYFQIFTTFRYKSLKNSEGYWAERYQINNVFTTTTETDPETEESVTTTTNSVTMTIEGNFICSGYATPLRCVKE